jgi:trans-2,3-dihydro-3-hydroxyanthranilate isomerase
MLTVPYVTVDVFTMTPFGGNPLAVIPDARGLSGVLMQQIAAEFHYSEVTFVLPPDAPENTARVRIFTPTSEVPFAGHPNVGTAFVLGQAGHLFGRTLGDTMRFEEGAGLVEVSLLREHTTVVGARIKAPRALTIDHIIEPPVIAACASLKVEDIITTHHEPVMASVGLPFALAEVSELAALAKAQPNVPAFADADRRYPHTGIRFSLFLYTRTSTTPFGVRARMFAPFDNVMEDPATGSASAALAAYLVSSQTATDLRTDIIVEQGVEMGRRSVIEIEVHKVGGVVQEVLVKGRCVPMMRGTLQFSNGLVIP